ncbi:hypothetical protein NP233_g10995 [Leucocoprinus birnbaumii]|uniref:DUF6589 domain-containing protein n=1 Tax=Leucocoprinus birnbaumii TaxID=56174 RepID=A0AAD5VH95_9AGAR|nr:hypothetical protein NP233_g10995 [Leucocoprinus birnbaumii]
MPIFAPLARVLTVLRETNLSILSVIQGILRDGSVEDQCSQLKQDATQIADVLYNHTLEEMQSWAFDLVTRTLQNEVLELTRPQHGLHFNATHTSAEYLKGSFMQETATEMRKYSPKLWGLMQRLLNANPQSQRARARNGGIEEKAIQRLGQKIEGSLGDLVNEEKLEEENQESKDVREGAESPAAMRNATLMVIKTVVCISILLQSTNKDCNYLQSILGIFFHLALVPEKVIETLAHAGLSVALSSIHSAIKSLSAEASQKLRESSLRQPFRTNPTLLAPPQRLQYHFMDWLTRKTYAVPGHWSRDPRNPDATEPFQINLKHLPKYEIAWHVRSILVNHGPAYFLKYKSELKEPKAINKIPLHKTNQMPCHAMDIKESTQDGNAQVLENLLWQGGLGEPGSKNLDKDTINISPWIMLLHGDLLTKERQDGVKTTRKIERTPKCWFQYVVFVPGLFHYLMACADVIWRIWVQQMAAREDPNSLFNHVGILRTNKTAKFASKPGFQMMHQVIQHDIWASMLDCWALVVRSRNSNWATLEDFGASEPSWDLIVELSHTIVQDYVASTERICSLRDEPKAKRDRIFENQSLQNRDELNYLELYHAMSVGNVGRVEATLPVWIYMFKVTGKHKYASHMLEFMYYLTEFYPPELAHIIQMNWLCNLTGKEGGFRGVDWMVERNNLYTKVIYGGSGSNCTLDHIIEESILIEFFRECHVSIENGFHLKNRTIHHSKPDMTKTLKALCAQFSKNTPHLFRSGREAKYEAPDSIELGMDEIRNNKEALAAKEGVTGVDEELSHEIKGGDLAAVDI